VTGSGYEITYVSACIHDSNKILTAILLLSRSAIFDFPPTLTSFHYVVRCKRYVDSVEISHLFHLRFECFWFHVRHFDFRLYSHRILHKAMLLSAAVTSVSPKTKAATLNMYSKGDLRPLIHWSPSFSPKYHPPHLHFRWRNSITGWTISKISTPFHHALMALGIHRSAMEISDGQLRYSRKTKNGCNFALCPMFEG